MKSYSEYTAEEFASDPEFLKWVKKPGHYPSVDNFWSTWLKENPGKKEEVEEARQMVFAFIHEQQYFPPGDKQQSVWKRIEQSAEMAQPEPKQAALWAHWYSKAAIIAVTVGIGWLGYYLSNKAATTPYAESGQAYYEKLINNADAPKTIVLSDGTSIVLQPHTAIEYPKVFAPDAREVFLTGEAFFEVAKDARRPFLVHAHEIVTRVLGTSFNVRGYEGEKNVVVQVRTGKVSVFKEKNNMNLPKGGPDETVEGVVLTANQQVVYLRDEEKMTKSLVENPSVVVPVAKQEFEFSDTPIKIVFASIEEAYGVQIVFDEEALANCYLNASLTDIPLYGKLKLICKAINATYEIMDSHIIVYGKGCEAQ